jgi:hypothetical protein
VLDPASPRSLPSALLALSGPVAIGAIVGANNGTFAATRTAIALPAVIAGLAVAMVPALYIGLAVTGSAPSPSSVLAAAGRGLRALGVSLIGVAAPLLFVLMTMQRPRVAVTLGAIAVAGAAFAGLRALYRSLFADAPPFLPQAILATWSLLALGIGVRLYTEVVSP